MSWVVLASALLTSSPLNANPPLADVQRQIQEAENKFQNGQYDEALELFQQVRDQHPELARRPQLEWNIARCWEMLGRYDVAIKAFERVEELYPDEERRQAARVKAESLRKIYFGSLVVRCAPDSQVEVGQLSGPQPCPGRWQNVHPGEYAGRVRNPQGQITGFAVSVRSSETSEVTPLGQHAAEETDAATAGGAVDIGPTEEIDFGAWPWLAAGLGAVSLGGMAWFLEDGTNAIESAGTANRQAESAGTANTQAVEALKERHERSQLGYYVTLSIGVALVTTSAVLFYLESPSSAAVVVSPGQVGVSVEW